jgi:hypothetical protein
MKIRLYLTTLILFVAPVLCSAGERTNLPSAADVVARMLASDALRQQSLSGYEGARRYVLVNDHMHKSAEMVVRVTGDPDGTKHFEIVSETGWKAAQKHVLRKMLESEEEASHPEARSKARLSLDNYEFQLVGTDELDGRNVYAIDVSPKRKEKYLIRGRIWVDAEDYALVRADGNPAKNPSFWTKSVHFTHTYQKSGMFWFPSTTDSLTEARIFGATALKIEYFDYKPGTSAVAVNGSGLAQEGSKP